jgi:hypothetical protein
MIKHLIKLANQLDQVGRHKRAGAVDNLVSYAAEGGAPDHVDPVGNEWDITMKRPDGGNVWKERGSGKVQIMPEGQMPTGTSKHKKTIEKPQPEAAQEQQRPGKLQQLYEALW